MDPNYQPRLLSNTSVGALCPYCLARTSFKIVAGNSNGAPQLYKAEAVAVNSTSNIRKNIAKSIAFMFLACEICGQGALAEVFSDANARPVKALGILNFYPAQGPVYSLPENLPDGIIKEFREAEVCAGAGAWRAGTAMLRSALEKTLKANGYTNMSLHRAIDKAHEESMITKARATQVHRDVRTLGNEVVHDDWKEVLSADFYVAWEFAGRLIEDFYGDRDSVLLSLIELGRLHPEESPS